MKIFDTIREALKDKEVKIVLPEGEEPRILQATKRLEEFEVPHLPAKQFLLP